MPILSTEQQLELYDTLRPLAEKQGRTLMFSLEVLVDPDGATRYVESEEFVDPVPPRLTEEEVAQLPATELHMAARWDCADCGRESFVRGIRLEDEQLRRNLGMEEDEAIGQPEEAHRYVWPIACGCSHCGSMVRAGSVV